MTAAPPDQLPALVRGVVKHTRHSPVLHRFAYATYLWLVDVDDLPRPRWPLSVLTTLRAEDHPLHAHRGEGEVAAPSRGTLRDNVTGLLDERGVLDSQTRLGRILMLANARQVGYVFDPITVFWCFDVADRLLCVVAEVRNTFGGRHSYVLRPDADGVAVVDKELYVSPFLEVAGRYQIRTRLRDDEVGVWVTLHQEGAAVFTASFLGRPQPARPAAVWAAVARQPLMSWRVTALIHWQGLRLWLRKIALVPRPPDAFGTRPRRRDAKPPDPARHRPDAQLERHQERYGGLCMTASAVEP